MEKKIKVENRSGKYLVTSIPNTNIKFIWEEAGSFVMLTAEQIKEIYYQPGGKLFFENLIIHDEDVCKDLLGEELEPEYFYTEAEIDKILLEGSIEQLEDALDFSPLGGIDLIVRRAVELKIPDYNKREAISKITGRDINKNIEFYSDSPIQNKTSETVKHRRAKPITSNSTDLKLPE